MRTFGSPEDLTPHLDALAEHGLLFRNVYATGTRTDRGLEAISMSVPPTPGRSVIKRPDYRGKFSIGPIFRSRGYEAKFIYGGNGFFDNMNAFFGENGFDAIDRKDLTADEVTFENAWGVCDEDLYRRVLKEADAAQSRNRPFLYLVMSTSNHRPYTYPQKIDIPSGQSRRGAVKYTDYAIGSFIDQARTRGWFAQTLFVVVADHCASSAGRADVQVSEYHIPLLIYGPGLVPARQVDTLMSQIDLSPTLLGLLKFSYRTKFYGKDVLTDPPDRALMGNYQKLALYVPGRAVILGPKQTARTYAVRDDGSQSEIAPDETLIFDAVSYYQSASHLLSRGLFSAE
jgi:phosphoglycerol transferase MdoB-like AlkP superfamily enzyme